MGLASPKTMKGLWQHSQAKHMPTQEALRPILENFLADKTVKIDREGRKALIEKIEEAHALYHEHNSTAATNTIDFIKGHDLLAPQGLDIGRLPWSLLIYFGQFQKEHIFPLDHTLEPNHSKEQLTTNGEVL